MDINENKTIDTNRLARVRINLIFFIYTALIFIGVEVIYGISSYSDDFFVESILSGFNGFASPYILVSEFPLSYLLYWLSGVLPAFNWLTMFELGCVWLAFSFLGIILYHQKSSILKVGAFVLPVIFEPLILTSLNYTICAEIASYAGLMFVLYSCINRKSKLGCIAGSCLAIVGTSLRFACFWMAVPFVGIWFLLEVKKNKKAIKVFLITFASIAVIVEGSHFLTQYMYSENKEIADYVEFNSLRSRSFDWLPSEYSEEYAQIGLSENDFKMIKKFIVNDSVYDTELYSKVADVNSGKQKTLSEKMTSFIKTYYNKFMVYQQGRFVGEKSFGIYFIIILVAALFFIRKNNWFPIIASAGGTIIIATYFIWTGRFPPWVQDGLFLMGLINICMSLKDFELKKNKKIVYLVLGGLCSVCAIAGILMMYRSLDKRHYVMNPDMSQVLFYMNENKDKIYMIDNFSNVPYPIMDCYGNKKGLKKGEWSNVLRVGSWYIEHPGMNAQLQALNLDSPLSDLIEDNVYLVGNTECKTLDIYTCFFKEHYDVDVAVSLVEQWGDYAIYKFSPQ